MSFGLLKWLWSFIRKEKALLALAICCALLASACIALGPRLIGLIVDNALSAKSTYLLLITCSIYAGCEVIRLIATSANSYFFQALGQRIIFDIRTSLFAHLLSLRIATLDQKLTGDINSRLTHDLDALSALCNAGFVRILEKLLFVSVMSISIYALSPQIGVLVLCAFAFFALFGILYSFKLASIFKQLRAKIGELNAFLSERITALPQIRFLCREDTESQRAIELSNHLRLLKHKPALFFGTLHASFTLVAGISVASLLYFSPGLIHSNAISVGTLVALISSLGLLFWPILIILYDWHIFVSGVAAASRIREVFDWECEPLEPQLHSWSAQGKIEFKNVWFAYTEKNWVLEDVSFCIHPGQSVALVGPTGSGKSSILSLLLRFYEPQKGQILLDDVPIQEIPIFELRKRLGFIPQDVQLFSGSIEDNISLWGTFKPPPLLTKQALNTVVSERGANLSVGQRQVISFSRTAAKEPQIWLVDEATSHLDPSLDESLMEQLAVLAKGKTKLIVAHRLQSITHSDLILVLHKGRLIEQGAHAELMTKQGLYFRLYSILFTGQESR